MPEVYNNLKKQSGASVFTYTEEITMYRPESNGHLYFYDEGKKFIDQVHGLTNLISDHDICVYSLTPKGQTTPAWLIVKVTAAKCMDRYLDSNASFSERCVVMERMDYERFSPMNLFKMVRTIGNVQMQNTKESIETRFYEKMGLFTESLTAEEFFSEEVDPDSDKEGAKIYLRDKAHFVAKS